MRTQALRPGMKLGVSVYSSRGLLLKQGMELGEFHIDRLRQARVDSVYIDDPLFTDVELPPDVGWGTKSALLGAYATLWSQVKSLGDPNALTQPLPWRVSYEQLMDYVSGLEEEMRAVPAWALQPVGQEREDDAPVVHAVNVGLLAAALGRQAGLGGFLRELALGGLLHDLGLALLPPELYHEDAEGLGEEELRWLHAHPLLGVKLLRGQPASAYVQAAVAQHHERFDGTGYPQKLPGQRIAPHAQLVAMADGFTRVCQAGMGRAEAWEFVLSGAGSEYDHRLVQAFAQSLPPFPLGTTVRLSTGEIGVVVKLEAGLLTRPQVRLLTDGEGRELQEPVTFDLAQAAHRNRVIVGEVLE